MFLQFHNTVVKPIVKYGNVKFNVRDIQIMPTLLHLPFKEKIQQLDLTKLEVR